MSRAALALALLPLLIAGCSGPVAHIQELTVQSQPHVAPGNSTATVRADGAAASTTAGYLDGLVVDAAIHPILGATVSATGVKVTALTGPGGQFKLGPLPEGSYFVRADAPGFQPAQAVAYIGEGAGKIKFVLDALPSTKPHHETQRFQGFADFTQTDTNTTGHQVAVLCNPCVFSVELDPKANLILLEATMAPYSYGPPGSNGFSFTLRDAKPVAMPNPLRYEVPHPAYNGTVRLELYPTGSPLPEFSKAFQIYVTSWFNEAPPAGWSFVAGDE